MPAAALLTNADRTRQLVARARSRGHVPAPMPAYQPPDRIEASYAARLRAMVGRAAERAYAPLIAALPVLVAQARAERGDAADWRIDGTHSGKSASAAVRAAQAAMAGELSSPAVAAEAKRAGQDVDGHSRGQVGKQVKRVLGIDLAGAANADQRALVTGFVHENVKLITGITPTLASEVERLVLAGLTGGQLHEMLAAAIRRRLQVSINRAELIAVDQIGKINGQVTAARHRALGVTRFKWVNVGDERVRGNPTGLYPNAVPSHWTRNGKVYLYSDPPKGKNGEAELPGVPIRCRCYGEPVLDDLLGAPAAAAVPVAPGAGAPPAPSTEEVEAEAARLMREVEAMLGGGRSQVAAAPPPAPPAVDPLVAARAAADADMAALRAQLPRLTAADLAHLLTEIQDPQLHFVGLPRLERMLVVGEAKALIERQQAALGQAVLVSSAPAPRAIGLAQAPRPRHEEVLRNARVVQYSPGNEGINGSYNGLLDAGTGEGMRAKIKPRDEEETGLHGIPDRTQHQREAAAAAIGPLLNVGDMMPTTIVRDLGPPFGVSSLQAFHEGSIVTAALTADQERRIDRRAVARMRVFDYVVGNSDRHGGNVMWADDRVTVQPRLIDHGLTLPPRRAILFQYPDLNTIDLGDSPLHPDDRAAIASIDRRAVALALAKHGVDAGAIRGTIYRIATVQADPDMIDIAPGEAPRQAAARWSAAANASAPGSALTMEQRLEIDDLVAETIAEAARGAP